MPLNSLSNNTKYIKVFPTSICSYTSTGYLRTTHLVCYARLDIGHFVRQAYLTIKEIKNRNDKSGETIWEPWHMFFNKLCVLETVQDFLIMLGIKPLRHLLEISIFSLNNDRLAKIMNNLVKDLKILSFKVIFKCLKLVKSFPKKNSVKNI